MLRLGAVLIAALLCTPAFAGLVETHFSDKSEEDVAAEFEAGIGKFLQARLGEPLKPRMWHDAGREMVWLELIEIKDSEGTWQTLERNGAWYTELNRYVFVPNGKTYKFNHADIPPKQVATWYVSQYRTAKEMVAAACWLASKEALLDANAVLADFATHKTDNRADIEAWLCEKNGWTVPTDGLDLVEACDLERDLPYKLLLSKQAAAEHYKVLDKEAKKAFKELEDLQGDDVKGKPGFRRGQPKMRLATLQNYVANFEIHYGDTSFMKKKSNKGKLEDIKAAIAEDIEWVNSEKFKAERFGIENDWPAAAKAYDQILRADPYNVGIMQATAEAWHKAAVVTDGARKAEDKAAAKKAAMIYESMNAYFPVQLAYLNHAGVNWLAYGDTKKAKQYHEEVIRRTDGRELSENEQKNRDFAAGQLKLIG